VRYVHPRLAARGADLHQDILGRFPIERYRLPHHLAKPAPAIARKGAAIEGEDSGPNDRKLQRVERVREYQLHGLGAEANAAMLWGEEGYGEMSLLQPRIETVETGDAHAPTVELDHPSELLAPDVLVPALGIGLRQRTRRPDGANHSPKLRVAACVQSVPNVGRLRSAQHEAWAAQRRPWRVLRWGGCHANGIDCRVAVAATFGLRSEPQAGEIVFWSLSGISKAMSRCRLASDGQDGGMGVNARATAGTSYRALGDARSRDRRKPLVAVARAVCAAAVVAVALNTAGGQQPASLGATGGRPFVVGERLTYAVEFGPLKVGTGTMEVRGIENVRGREAYHTVFRINGGIPLYRVDDTFESWFATDDLASLRFHQDQNEGQKDRNRRYEIFPERRVYDETTDDKGEQPSVAEPLDDGSFVYFVRTVPLEVGRSYEFQRYFKPDRNPVTIRVLRRERITVPAGTFDAVVIQPVIKTKGVFSEEGRAELWLSDDERRLILQMKSRLSFGSIDLYLTNIQRP